MPLPSRFVGLMANKTSLCMALCMHVYCLKEDTSRAELFCLKEIRMPHSGLGASEAVFRMSNTRFLLREAFISARSATVGCMASWGMCTWTPGSLVISLSSLAVKAACRHGRWCAEQSK